MRKLLGACGLVVFCSITFSKELGANIHTDTNQCVLADDTVCNDVCLSCHFSPPTNEEMQQSGDVAMCAICHDQEAVPAEWVGLLVTNGGNHPSQVAYDPYKAGGDLVRDPFGPVLYCEESGTNCMMLCSTCHDPHGDKVALLRVDNNKSALCFSCHQK